MKRNSVEDYSNYFAWSAERGVLAIINPKKDGQLKAMSACGCSHRGGRAGGRSGPTTKHYAPHSMIAAITLCSNVNGVARPAKVPTRRTAAPVVVATPPEPGPGKWTDNYP